jgi:tetratricopeptide (TPR) repeat protein
VVDVHLAHPSTFHHGVEGDEVFFDEAKEIELIVLDASFRLTEALDAGEVGEKAEGHHLQGLCFEIAEEKPVGPDFVEVLVEFPDFRDGVEFVRIVVPAIHQELDEAIPLLTRVVKDHPSHPHGWVALGVAYARQNNLPSAINALKKAVEINPQDGHSHKNLGAILAQSGAIAESIPHLRRATALLPNDPSTWLNLGLTLEDQGELDAADEAFVKVLSLDPTGQLGERAQRGRSQIAEKSFRERGGNLRPDAVSYCLNALKRFEGMPKPEIQKISFEIAMLGTRGLDVNSPEQKYTLNSIPGNFSGLQLLCIEYVGFQIINPSLDLGFDLSREYQAALALYDDSKG